MISINRLAEDGSPRVEMRLARLLLISGLAARAGAEAAADWFPRWSSGGSDDEPQMQVWASGSAAAAVLKIVREDRRKRGDRTPVTVLFPNKTILEMPPDGDQVDTFPDGTSLIFDSTSAAAPSDTVAASPGPGEVPENLCCPISMELMTQPVLAADGFTYDRASIEAWLARGKTTSPTTGAPLEHTHLTPNHLVKSMIAEYQESKG